MKSRIVGHFELRLWRKLTPQTQSALESALHILCQFRGDEWKISQPGLFGRFGRRQLIAMKDGVVSTYASVPVSRPARTLMLATDGWTGLVPSERPEDFQALARLLKLTDIRDIVELHSTVHGGALIFLNADELHQIKTPDDLPQFGIETDPAVLADADDQTTFWWQRFGGQFFSFRYEPTTPLAIKTVLGNYTGHYARLPRGIQY